MVFQLPRDPAQSARTRRFEQRLSAIAANGLVGEGLTIDSQGRIAINLAASSGLEFSTSALRIDLDTTVVTLASSGVKFATQTANTLFTGPTTGAAAIPTFRVMVTADIPNTIVTYAKIQNVSNTDRLLGRSTAGAGIIEEITCTSFARSLLDDSDAATARATLGAAASTAVTISLFDHFANAGNSTTTETDLYSDTIAAARLATNGDKLRAEYGGTFVSSATATRQVKLYFGGTAIFDTGTLTLSLSSAWTMYATVQRVSSSVVRYMISMTTEGAALAAYTAVGELTGLTLANTQVMKITGQAAGVGAATNDIVAMLSHVIFIPAA